MAERALTWGGRTLWAWHDVPGGWSFSWPAPIASGGALWAVATITGLTGPAQVTVTLDTTGGTVTSTQVLTADGPVAIPLAPPAGGLLRSLTVTASAGIIGMPALMADFRWFADGDTPGWAWDDGDDGPSGAIPELAPVDQLGGVDVTSDPDPALVAVQGMEADGDPLIVTVTVPQDSTGASTRIPAVERADPFTLDWWASLPQAWTRPDTLGVLLSWMDGIGHLGGSLRSELDGMDTATATDPTTVPRRLWPLLALILHTTPTQASLVAGVGNGLPALGTRQHIRTVALGALNRPAGATGDPAVIVEPDPDDPWTIRVHVQADRLPAGGTDQVAAAVTTGSCVPAGHRVVVDAVEITWDAYQSAVTAAGGTWDAADSLGRTWNQADTIGI